MITVEKTDSDVRVTIPNDAGQTVSEDYVIVDANLAFKCLYSGRGDLRERIGPGRHLQCFSPRFLFVELF